MGELFSIYDASEIEVVILIEQVTFPARKSKTEARKLKHQRERATRAGGELYRARFGTGV